MHYLGLIVLGFAAILGISFAVLNAQSVTFNYYLGTHELPLSLLLIAILVFGICIGLIASWPSLLRLKFENRRLRRSLYKQQQG